MKAFGFNVLVALAGAAAPLAAGAQPQPAPPQQHRFEGLWTGWNAASRDAARSEAAAARQEREALAAADARRLAERRVDGIALGERVGEIVRLGDCEEGERIALAARDFALVQAVRRHCGIRGPH